MGIDVVDPTPPSPQLFNDVEVAELARGIAMALNLVVEQVVARVSEQIEAAAARAVMASQESDKPEPERLPAWLTLQEAAAVARRHRETLYGALQKCRRTNGREGLRGYQTSANSTWRIHRDDLDRWVHGDPPSRSKRRIRR